MKDGSVGLGVKSKGTMSTKVAARGISSRKVRLTTVPNPDSAIQSAALNCMHKMLLTVIVLSVNLG